MSASPLLDTLKAATDRAAAAESAFRRDSAERIKTLERERAFAFRKLNLMKAVTAAVAEPEKDEDAVAAGVASLRDKLGWVETSDARTTVLDRFAEVARAVRNSVASADGEASDPLAALEAFETWYAETHTVVFWVLFEQYIQENTVVAY
jgi:hypothetical protein